MSFGKPTVSFCTTLLALMFFVVKPSSADDCVGVTCCFNENSGTAFVHELLENGGLWWWNTNDVGDFDFITTLPGSDYVDLDGYYNTTLEAPEVYAVRRDGRIYRYSIDDGIQEVDEYEESDFNATAVYYNTELSIAVVYSVTEGGDLYKYATSEGCEYIGNFGTDLIVGLSVYYNYSLSQAVVYAVVSNGDLRKYATGEGFEDIDDDFYDPIVDIATYYNAGAAEAVVYGVTSGGQLWEYSTSTGLTEIGNFGTAGVVGLATYYNDNTAHAVVYALTYIGGLWEYSTNDGFYGNVAAVEDPIAIPTAQLHQNYPNPFNPSSTIEFTLLQPRDIQLTVYNIQGHQVTKLVDEPRNAGIYQVRFDGYGLASGVYVYRLVAGDQVVARKMVLIR